MILFIIPSSLFIKISDDNLAPGTIVFGSSLPIGIILLGPTPCHKFTNFVPAFNPYLGV